MLINNEKFRSEEIQRKFEHSKNVLEEIFPNYDAQVAELPEMEYPPEFTFHLRKAPVLPQFQTSLFRSPGIKKDSLKQASDFLKHAVYVLQNHLTLV